MKLKILSIILFYSLFCVSQSDDKHEDLIIITGDSIPKPYINLNEVILFQPLSFDTYDAAKKYAILRSRTYKVYPYAKLAADRLKTLNDRLKFIKKNKQKRKYLRRLEKFIYEEFEKDLKKLSRSQGKILIKLIHRQTGQTTHNLIKELRNSFKARIYQTTASFFKLSLKIEYDPKSNYEDYLIEDILLRAFSSGKLDQQPTALDYDLDELFKYWKKKKDKEVENKKSLMRYRIIG
ncbi:MAG: hypothetical protein CMC81_01235 [Flavobacteriaceae bacterium]|nr:hypothetical protein [Flavobacteriaceae bacterium]|tara:strand:- start:3018 stop:3725 length:708 start_codon:yes stop_codon:yes gene_type:complete